MAESAPVAALATPEMRVVLERRLTPIGIRLMFVRRVADLLVLTRKGQVFSVVILPASLPDGDVWAVWGELALLTPRPEFVVYAQTASFELWSGVLEAGGHDVLVEPYRAEEVRKTVLEARRAFEKRQAQEAEQGPPR